MHVTKQKRPKGVQYGRLIGQPPGPHVVNSGPCVQSPGIIHIDSKNPIKLVLALGQTQRHGTQTTTRNECPKQEAEVCCPWGGKGNEAYAPGRKRTKSWKSAICRHEISNPTDSFTTLSAVPRAHSLYLTFPTSLSPQSQMPYVST